MPEPRKDNQTVTNDGKSVKPMINGVNLKMLTTLVDERGELCEFYRPSWGLSDAPMVFAYQVSVRPKQTRGWVVHKKQDDRIVLSLGTLQWALYDDRSDSSTYRQLDVFTLSERNRGVFVIPRGVYHALLNVGDCDAYFMNFPTEPYNHEDPDKYRLPLDTDLIPFPFVTRAGE